MRRERKEVVCMMSTGEAASCLGVSYATVRRWVKLGLLPVAMKTPTGRLRFDEAEVKAFVDECVKNGRSITSV